MPLKTIASLIFLSLSFLLTPSQTLCAPAKTTQQNTEPQKSTQPERAANPSGSGSGALNPAPALATEPGNIKNTPSSKTDEIAVGKAGAKADKILATINGTNITQFDYERYMLMRGVNPLGGGLTSDMIDATFEGLFAEILVRDYLAKQGRMNDPMLMKRIAGLQVQAYSEYFQYLVALGLKTLTEAEVQTFILEHPDYFKDRRYYYFTSIEIIKNADVDVSQIRSLLTSTDNFDKILTSLNSKKISYTVFRGFKPTEMIDETLFSKLKTMSPGESALVTDPENKRIFICKLFSSSPDPIEAEKKREEIRLALIMGRVAEQTSQLLKQMRDSADIKFIDKPKANIVAQPGKFSAANVRPGASTASLFKKFDNRGRVLVDKEDFAKDVATATSQNKSLNSNQLLLLLAMNIWVLSLLLIVPATFYHYLKTSSSLYSDLIYKNTMEMNQAPIRYQLQKMLLDPLMTWIIGLAMSLLIAYFAWDGFSEKNLYTLYFSKTYIILSAISALFASALLIFITYRIYLRLPDYLKNLRLMFFSIVMVSNILILKVL